jgi:hypothetical protein
LEPPFTLALRRICRRTDRDPVARLAACWPDAVGHVAGGSARLAERRRSLPTFIAALSLVFAVLWFATGQGIGNLDDYAVNTASVVSGYSASMVYIEPGHWWQGPSFIIGIATVAVLCVAAGWKRDNARRVGLAFMVAAVVFLNFKHSAVRASPGNAAVFLASLLAVGVVLAPYARRLVAISAIAVLVCLALLGNRYLIDSRLEFTDHASHFAEQLGTI